MTATEPERKLRELSFLHEVAQLASSARDWDEMLRIVIGRTTDAMGAEVSSLYLLERPDGTLRLVATNGLNRGGIGRATLRVGEGIVGWVANARVPLAARDVRTEPRWKWVPEVDEKRLTSMLSVPVVARDEVIGVMNVQTVEPRDFGREEIDFLQTIANQVAGIIENGRLQRESDRKLREVSALFEVRTSSRRPWTSTRCSRWSSTGSSASTRAPPARSSYAKKAMRSASGPAAASP